MYTTTTTKKEKKNGQSYVQLLQQLDQKQREWGKVTTKLYWASPFQLFTQVELTRPVAVVITACQRFLSKKSSPPPLRFL